MQAESQRVLVLVGTPRDGELAVEELAQSGVSAELVTSVLVLRNEIAAGAGAAIIAEEFLSDETVATLADILRVQPAWSDFPILVIARRRLRSDADELRSLGNVTFLDPPLRIRTLRRAVNAALRGRLRQYDAARAIDERDRFLAMLGHELRNPLSAIKLAAEVGASRADKTPREIEIIQRQSEHLGRLVDDLLDVARVTRGKIKIQKRPVDLGALIRRQCDLLGPRIDAKGLTMTVDIDSNATVLGDEDRLAQVSNNLLSNALKYTPEGGAVTVTVRRKGADVLFDVIDDGVGMSEAFLASAFDVFAQADETLARSDGGMGIGLALVRSIVTLHGGTVQATSEGVGCGTHLSVRLPWVHVETSDAASNDRTASAANNTCQLVLVDDNEDALMMLSELLQARGFAVATATTGEAGVHRILTMHPDVAIVDIGLPDIDGYEVSRRCRDELDQAVRLVALTGYGQPDDRARSVAAGFDAHFTKPADVSALLTYLDEVCRN